MHSLGHKNRVVFYVFGCIKMIFNFIEVSPTQHSTLEKISEQTNTKLKKLKSLLTIRRACKSESVEAVNQNYYSLLQCLLEMCKTTELPNVRFKENRLLHTIKSFNFIFALTILKPILIQIHIVNAKLQLPDLYLEAAVNS